MEINLVSQNTAYTGISDSLPLYTSTLFTWKYMSPDTEIRCSDGERLGNTQGWLNQPTEKGNFILGETDHTENCTQTEQTCLLMDGDMCSTRSLNTGLFMEAFSQ